MFDSYFELHAHTSFSFLRGVIDPSDLVARAQELGLSGVAALDYDGLYATVQINQAAREYGIKCAHGSEITLSDGSHLPLLVRSVRGYSQLAQTLTKRNLAASGKELPGLEISALKGEYFVMTGSRGGYVTRHLWGKEPSLMAARSHLGNLVDNFGKEAVAVELQPPLLPGQNRVNQQLVELAASFQLPVVATGAVRALFPQQVPTLDILQANQMRLPLAQARGHLPANRMYLHSPRQLQKLFMHLPQAVENTQKIGEELAFDLQLLAPGLPRAHETKSADADLLRELTYAGARQRYGEPEENPSAWEVIEKELKIISQLGFCGYFLIVKDIVDFCVKENILCQGRGSAANSAVCFALGVTAVDAVKHQMMFERFLSPLRTEAPDIDLDIESARREEVIQYVYEKYGRERAALVANVITYRARLALKDAAFALGFSPAQTALYAKQLRGTKLCDLEAEKILVTQAQALVDLPRHLGTHPGGMVLADRPLAQICPLQKTSMAGRTILQWDKEDCQDAGLVKFDLLGLGMLTAIRKCFAVLHQRGERGEDGKPLGLHNIGTEDRAVYDLLCAADTVGVFQVESRAQMNTLPRLRPRTFYDIVIEVALIRPGPIQGGAVNPYLRRRQGREKVTFLHELLRPALEKTLGIPLFQEQLMKIAVDAADFTPAQADQLRRAMGAKRSAQRMEALKPQLLAGMTKKGIDSKTAQKIYEQLGAFAKFGFPESHSFSFAYIVYASAWLKVHHPELFYAALLSSQPLGFYSPASLVADAKRRGIKVLPVSVNSSQVQTEAFSEPFAHIRLGFDQVRGLGTKAQQIVSQRPAEGYSQMSELAAKAGLGKTELELLAKAGALDDLGINRREGIWEAGVFGAGIKTPSWRQPCLPGVFPAGKTPHLKPLGPWQQVSADLEFTGSSTGAHPLELCRLELTAQGVTKICEIREQVPRSRLRVAGIVTHRQRPGTAKGVTFLSLEDETGIVNVTCKPGFWHHHKTLLELNGALIIRGTLQVDQGALSILADGVQPLKVAGRQSSRDFR